MSGREDGGPAVPRSGFGVAALMAAGASAGGERLCDCRESFSTSREIVLLAAGTPTWTSSVVGLSLADDLRSDGIRLSVCALYQGDQ